MRREYKYLKRNRQHGVKILLQLQPTPLVNKPLSNVNKYLHSGYIPSSNYLAIQLTHHQSSCHEATQRPSRTGWVAPLAMHQTLRAAPQGSAPQSRQQQS